MIFATVALAAALVSAQPQKPAGISEAAIDWLKVYPLAPFREYWTLTLEVKDLEKDLPRVMKALDSAGGTLQIPLANAAGSVAGGVQQLSYRLPGTKSAGALKALKKIGKPSAPIIRRSGEPIAPAEIKAKIDQLSRDKQAQPAALAAMPAVSALVDAALSHLVTVQAVVEKGEIETHLNLTVTQAGAK